MKWYHKIYIYSIAFITFICIVFTITKLINKDINFNFNNKEYEDVITIDLNTEIPITKEQKQEVKIQNNKIYENKLKEIQTKIEKQNRLEEEKLKKEQKSQKIIIEMH